MRVGGKKEKKDTGEECGRASGFEMKECVRTNTHTHKKAAGDNIAPKANPVKLH